MPHAQLKDSLISMQHAIKTANSDQLTVALLAIETIAANERGTLHPQLAHFLERRSYAKALAWLEGEATGSPPGGCSR